MPHVFENTGVDVLISELCYLENKVLYVIPFLFLAKISSSASSPKLLSVHSHSRFPAMESQMVQNSRTKIGFTLSKFSIKVKADFNQAQQSHSRSTDFLSRSRHNITQAQQNEVITFNKFPFKAKRCLSQAQE